MTKIDLFSGFLGAGKTTLIKKLIAEAYAGEKLVIIENEFGDISIDGGFLAEAGVQIREMSAGCICCSLVGDFSTALGQVYAEYHPDRILIEPSGVGKLSDVIRAVESVAAEGLTLNSAVTVVDAKKCKMYMKNFGEFFNDQIGCAKTVVLSHTGELSDEKINTAVALVREKNDHAQIVTTPWEQLSGAQILEAMEAEAVKPEDLLADVCPVCGEKHDHHHHHHEHDEHEHHHEHDHDHDHGCGCDHDHEHEHHHHDHEHEHHEHDHDHGDGCSCGCGHDHHHHHADEVFQSWGKETASRYTEEGLRQILTEIQNESRYGMVLRAKGIVAGDGVWYHFDYTPGDIDVRTGAAAVTGRLCVIGADIQEDALAALFA